MSQRSEYPAGVPCWVENLTDDVAQAQAFYGQLFGWTWHGPGRTGGDAEKPYFVALLDGAEVAGVAAAPDPVKPTWMTQVRVAAVEPALVATEQAGGSVVAGPIEIPPAGRLAVIADPDGAVLTVFEPAARQGAQRVNEPGAWAMSTLITPDAEAARSFYGSVFGWSTEPYGPVTLFRLPGYVGGEPEQPSPRDVVAVMMPAGGGPARWSVDFWIADIDQAAEIALAAGGLLSSPIETSPPFRRATITDPAGAQLTLSQLTLAG